MRPVEDMPREMRRAVRAVLTDIDDTLTLRGRLPAVAYQALEDLHAAGLTVVPITGRPAGWCDHMARMWPVDGVVGENGAFYFRYDDQRRVMVRRYAQDASLRQANEQRLARLAREIPAAVAGSAVSADQRYREADLAIDFCEDVAPLPLSEAQRIQALFEAAGATAKISSIHVNGWFGSHDKLSMTRVFFAEVLGWELDAVREKVVFAGDSPNDAPMFAYFANAVAMANALDFGPALTVRPAWITRAPGGQGFAELARLLLDARGE